VAEVLGDGALAFLAGTDGQHLELRGLYHPDAASLARMRAMLSTENDGIEERLVGRVFRSGEPLRASTQADAASPASRDLELYGIHSFVLVPLRARGRVIGTLGMWRQQGRLAYTAHDQHVLQELAERAGLAIDNARLLAETRAAVRLRDEVLGAVSHDLKGPLSTIKGTAQVLQRRVSVGNLSSERLLEAAQRIDAAATRMISWVEELLDVVQIEAGRTLNLRLGQVDLVELTAQAVADHQQATPDHTIVLGSAPSRLVGWFDAARLRRVLDNLLSNAVKYSPGGEPITLRVRRTEDDGGAWAVLEVEDQGVGIPAADQPHVFERFHRARNVGRVVGTGIGLAGARQIVEQHGGRIDLKSQEGQGSTFSVCLPLPPSRDHA
jgi:signal transduction histidine kinase